MSLLAMLISSVTTCFGIPSPHCLRSLTVKGSSFDPLLPQSPGDVTSSAAAASLATTYARANGSESGWASGSDGACAERPSVSAASASTEQQQQQQQGLGERWSPAESSEQNERGLGCEEEREDGSPEGRLGLDDYCSDDSHGSDGDRNRDGDRDGDGREVRFLRQQTEPFRGREGDGGGAERRGRTENRFLKRRMGKYQQTTYIINLSCVVHTL